MKRHKYSAQKVIYDGITFHSKKEGRRYLDLKLLEKSGKISELKLQVPYPLIPNIYIDTMIWEFTFEKGKMNRCIQRGTFYIADFAYMEKGKEVVEDVKGFRTATYRKKANQMKKIYGITILET